ncbi:T9SS type A sorting domain-containing protein [Flavihumibacter fluvii]|uniref:T9SS type A sorting domain-containing protein n=1 Tax=Flavihumibacter fluvii TaxID=2838157 RepID=UPI001BDDFDD7|nr:T9SS type A sorting domain-containing protein [Flavihumibacter fluvii]ULQ51623.1 T9SS type A sorting domain-containing protein [Flavihumibacter fluvii]
MRLLTHFLSAALVCLFHTTVAQPHFGTSMQGLVAGATGPLAIGLEEPVLAGKGKLQLQWVLNSTLQKGYINVERSSYKQGPFEVLAVLRQDGTSGKFVDEQPLKGKCYYRIKWVPENGWQQFSRIVSSSFAGDMTCKFYPNPVDNMLIVRSEQALELLLTDANGKIYINKKLKSGLQTVDVSGLDKGLYIIILTQTESGRVITEKLIKN